MSKTVMTVKFADMPGRKFNVKEADGHECGLKEDPDCCAFFQINCFGLRTAICVSQKPGYYFKEVLPK